MSTYTNYQHSINCFATCAIILWTFSDWTAIFCCLLFFFFRSSYPSSPYFASPFLCKLFIVEQWTHSSRQWIGVKKGFDLILNLMYGNGQDMKNIFYQFMFGLMLNQYTGSFILVQFSSICFFFFSSHFFVCLSDDGFYRIFFIHSCIRIFICFSLSDIWKAYNIDSAKDESFIFRKICSLS